MNNLLFFKKKKINEGSSINFFIKSRKKDQKNSSMILQSTTKPNMFDYGFEAGKNYDVYCPQNNMKTILSNLEISSTLLKKKKMKERKSIKESKHSNFFNLKNQKKK